MTALLETDGFAWGRGAVDREMRASLIAVFAETTATVTADTSQRGESVYALRNALEVPEVRALTTSSRIRSVVEPVLGTGAFPVRGIFFEKTADANWSVPWHQDLSIAVRMRQEVPGWGPWSVKAGVPHVQPPVSLLERMVTTRIHLDECGPENVALLVLPGTHRLGRLDAARIADLADNQEALHCFASAGDILLMSPLLLHSSRRAVSPSHRRILHLEWAAEPLPEGLEWFDTVKGTG